jgi:hypothetical protein
MIKFKKREKMENWILCNSESEIKTLVIRNS